MENITGIKFYRHKYADRLFAVELSSGSGIKGRAAFASSESNGIPYPLISEIVVGADAFGHDGTFSKLKQYRAHITAEIIAALDNALFELSANAMSQPMYQLLGGKVREKNVLAAYPDASENADIIKLNFKGSAYYSRENLAANLHEIDDFISSRPAIPGGIMLLCNEGLDNEYAVRMAKELRRLSVRYLEIPISSSSYMTLRRLKDILNPNGVLLTTAETEHSLYTARELISNRCVDMIRVSIPSCGISEAKKINSYAQMSGVMTVPVGKGLLTRHFSSSCLTAPFTDLESTAEDRFFGEYPCENIINSDNCAEIKF